MVNDIVCRRELAEFLRSKRERLAPEAVGLTSIGRRRTPGLRREEVADLAGLGLAWYTWLEQARPINVTSDVLWAIARALRLSCDERNHLLNLGRPHRLPRDLRDDPDEISNRHRAVLDALDPNPAHIRDRCFNLIAWNSTFEAIFSASSRPKGDRNLLLMFFTDKQTMRVLENWEESAAYAVGQFRFDCASRLQYPEVQDLIEQLHDASPTFTKLWREQSVCSGVGTSSRVRLANDVALLDRAIYPIDSESDPGLMQGPRLRLAVHIPKAGTPSEGLLHSFCKGCDQT